MFLLNSRQRYFSCGPACAGQALSRSYGRFFAEFLGEKSLVLLGLLALSTCVGFRYGFTISNLRGFSWKHAQSTWQNKSSTLPQLLGLCAPDLPNAHPQAKDAKPLRRLTYYTPSPHRKIMKGWNINQLSIGCGFPHCLRTA